jgi:hypothetical protein
MKNQEIQNFNFIGKKITKIIKIPKSLRAKVKKIRIMVNYQFIALLDSFGRSYLTFELFLISTQC